MKKNVKLIMTIFALLMFNNMQAEWKRDSVTTLPNVNATWLINSKVRIALSGQYVYRTEDAGLTWQKDLMFAKNVYQYITHLSLTFMDDKTGFIQYNVSNDPTTPEHIYVYKTTDSGKNWEIQIITTPNAEERIIKFASELNWIVYGNKTMHVTTDGGVSWYEKTLNNSDTTIYNVEILNNDWYVFSGNADADNITISTSSDKGNTWKKMIKFHLYDRDSSGSFFFVMPRYAGIAKTSQGLSVIYNIYYPGCGAYYDHSVIFNLEQDPYNNWRVKHTAINDFNQYPPSGIFYKNDTGYITTYDRIYKSNGPGQEWFPSFKMQHYKFGNFEAMRFVDGILWAYTSKGVMYRNENPFNDRNILAVPHLGSRGSDVLVYPNPATEYLTFRFADVNAMETKISIFDMNGKIVFEQNYTNEKEIIVHTGHLSVGIYTYRVTNNNKTTYGKIKLRI